MQQQLTRLHQTKQIVDTDEVELRKWQGFEHVKKTQENRMPNNATMAVDDQTYKPNVFNRLYARAVEESVIYAERHLSTAMIFSKKENVWNYAARRTEISHGLILEFGVFKARSTNHLADKFSEETIYGFDSFEGLAEDWTENNLVKGYFTLNGRLPQVRENVELIKGWFDQTLPDFLNDHPNEKIKFCHIDCDTHDSALYVLSSLADRFTIGTVIVFDEYYGYPNWKNGEFLAWQTVCEKKNIDSDYIAFSNMEVAVIIK